VKLFDLAKNVLDTFSNIPLSFVKSKWRSPEEYFDRDLDQQVDVFSLGNNIYSLLTGLWVFYEGDENVAKRVKAGDKPYIDPRYTDRSLAEARLAEIIDKCLSYYPEDRPSIFEVVKFLRNALKEVRQ
jgi:serine/threonine protein kinase